MSRPTLPQDPRLVPAADLEPLFKISTLADYLIVDERTIHRMLASGRLPQPDLRIGTGSRGSPRWRRSTIDAWIAGGGRA